MLPDPMILALAPGTTGFLVVCVLAYLIFASWLTFRLFRTDRARVLTGDGPLPDGVLLAISALGGWPGAKLAQARLRHRRRSGPFGTLLNLTAAGQVVVLLANLVPVADAASLAADWAGEIRGAALIVADAPAEG